MGIDLTWINVAMYQSLRRPPPVWPLVYNQSPLSSHCPLPPSAASIPLTITSVAPLTLSPPSVVLWSVIPNVAPSPSPAFISSVAPSPSPAPRVLHRDTSYLHPPPTMSPVLPHISHWQPSPFILPSTTSSVLHLPFGHLQGGAFILLSPFDNPQCGLLLAFRQHCSL
jgi:hypothetical protein